MLVDFFKKMEMVVLNTYFEKRQKHRLMYKRGRFMEVGYILCRRCNLKVV